MALIEPPIAVDFPSSELRRSFRTTDELLAWVERERAEWNWLQTGNAETDQGVAGQVQGALNNLWNVANQLEANPAGYRPEVINQLTAAYGGALPTVLYSASEQGRLINDILERAGKESAAFAYALYRHTKTPDNARTRGQLQGLILYAFPDLARPSQISQTLAAQRRQTREAGEALQLKLEVAVDMKIGELNQYFTHARRVAWRAADRAARRWQNERETVRKQADQAISDIKAVEATYREDMRLRSSVEYWYTKAGYHDDRRRELGNSLRLFAAGALGALVFAFGWAGSFVLESAGFEVNGFIDLPASGGGSRPEAPTAIYLIVSGLLAAVTTLVFWAGRLLVRMYLSEHHLERDARERAIMTQTYLALLSEQGAQESDRPIILGALFRSTSDGIVKDDGVPDSSLQAMLSRLLSQHGSKP